MSDTVDIHDFQIIERPDDSLAKLIDAHAPGIYFGMPEAEYHADRSLSATGAKDILASPLTFWMKSAFNPDRKDESTEPKERGKAFHCRLLEGAETFAARYAVEPDESDYPGVLRSSDALKARCEELGLKKSGSIADLCARVIEADPDAILWPRIMEEFEHDLAVTGRERIKPKLAREIARHVRIIEMHPATEKALRGGFCEVSFFWIDPETGVPMKARADYLKSRATVELKTFTNPFSKPLDAAVASSMANNKYFIDAVTRTEAVERAKGAYRKHGAEIVFGQSPPAEWLEAFAHPAPHAFVFLFLEAGHVPNVRVREFRRFETAPQGSARPSENMLWSKGHQLFRQAVAAYRACLDHYGPDLPWVDPQPMRAFVDADFPLYVFD